MNHLKVVYISPYSPRQCGIANYTENLISACHKLDGNIEIDVIPIDDKMDNFTYTNTLRLRIQYDEPESYVKAAKILNRSKYDYVHIQHEFGLYGGEDGELILKFINALKKPYVITFHTILSNPNENKVRIVQALSESASAIIVMAGEAIKRLRDIYRLSTNNVFKIAHGVPDISYINPNRAKKKLGLEARKIISTFGLISQNKGIEYVINAIPQIKQRFPDILYLVIGKTHPIIQRYQGEKYREMLIYSTFQNDTNNNVRFINKYLDFDELILFLQASDIYITPYLEPEQITSGTLAYALGAGKACISTPYAYAKEVLADQRGSLVPFRDSHGIAEKVIRLLSDKDTIKTLSLNSYQYSRSMVWNNVAKEHLNLFMALSKRERNSSESLGALELT